MQQLGEARHLVILEDLGGVVLTNRWPCDENAGATLNDPVGNADADISNLNAPWPGGAWDDYGVWLGPQGTETGAGEAGDCWLWEANNEGSLVVVVWPKIGLDAWQKQIALREKCGVAQTQNWGLRRIAGADDEVEFYYRNSGDTAWHVYQTSNLNLVADAFAMITLVYRMGDGASLKIYKGNGVLVSGSWTTGNGNDAPRIVGGQELLIGASNKTGGASFRGFLAELRNYGGLLSVSEIQTIYGSLSSRFGW